MHQLITYATEECLGIDSDYEAVEYLHHIGISNVICENITKPGIKEIEKQQWDYIILGEVLEHVPDPVAFMKQIKDNYGKYVKYFIITVLNAFGLIQHLLLQIR